MDGECILRWFHLGCTKCHNLQWERIVSVYRSRAVASFSMMMAFRCMTGTRIWRRTFKMHLLFNKMQCIMKTMHCYSIINDVIFGKLLHIYLRDCWERAFINSCDAKQYVSCTQFCKQLSNFRSRFSWGIRMFSSAIQIGCSGCAVVTAAHR